MSTESIDHAAHGTTVPTTVIAHVLTQAGVSKVHLGDSSEELAHRNQYETQLKRPMRMISSAGTPAKDVTVEFRAAASSTPTSRYLHPPAKYYSVGDRTACQRCLLHTLRVRRRTRGMIRRSVRSGVEKVTTKIS